MRAKTYGNKSIKHQSATLRDETSKIGIAINSSIKSANSSKSKKNSSFASKSKNASGGCGGCSRKKKSGS